MRKKVLLFVALMAAFLSPYHVWAYDFSYTYQGQTLYYNIVNGNAEVTYPWGTYFWVGESIVKPIGSITIPASVSYGGNTYSVTAIDYNAFISCDSITSVQIPSTVVSIRNGAFSYCSQLTTVELPEGLNSIGVEAFYSCTSLQSLTVPSSLSTIEARAFMYCTILSSVNYNAVNCTHSGAVFTYCTNLTTVIFGNSVTNIPASAFSGCDALTTVSISNSVTTIGEGAFSGCSSLSSVSIPNSVTNIESSAFSGCSGLTSITIPASVTSIGTDSPFSGCYNLSVVNFNAEYCNAGYVWDGYSPVSVFYDLPNLTTVNFGDSVHIIPAGLFQNCSALTNVVLPTSVTSIGAEAFSGCSSIHRLDIPATVTSIGESALCGIDTVSFQSATPFSATTAFFCVFEGTMIVPCGSGAAYRAAWEWAVPSIQDPCESPILLTLVNSGNGNFGYVNQGYLYMVEDSVVLPSYVGQEYTLQVVYYIGNSNYEETHPPLSHIYVDGVELDTDSLPTGHLEYGGIFHQFNITMDSSHTIVAMFERPPTAQITIINNGGGYMGYTGIGLDTIVEDVAIGNEYTVYMYSFNPELTDWALGNFIDSWNSAMLKHIYVDGIEIPMESLVSESEDGIILHYYSFTVDTSHTIEVVFGPWSSGFNVTALSSDSTLGIVTGSGSYNEFGHAVLSALTHVGNTFNGWSNGSMENPLTLTVTSDTTLIALFSSASAAVTDTLWMHDTTTVVDTVTLTEYVPVHDTTYINVHDTSYIVLTDTLTVTLYDTIINTVFDTIDNYIYDTTLVTDTLWLTQYDTITNTVFDTVDNYIYDTTIVTDTLWLTQYDTIWLYDTVVVHDTIYITQEGVDGAETTNAKIYQRDGHVVVEGVELQTVALYDAVGRVMAVKRNEGDAIRFDVPASGTYLVKVGSAPARRIVVVR